MEKITWYETEQQFSILPNHYYILRLHAEDTKNIGETITVQCRFTYSGRELNISLPVISGRDNEFAQPSVWMERYLIFKSDILEYKISLFSSLSTCNIKAALQLWPIELCMESDTGSWKRLHKQIDEAKSVHVKLFNQDWPVFQGLEGLNISSQLFDDMEEKINEPLLAAIPAEKNMPHLLCWGDPLFIQTLSQSCSAVSIEQWNSHSTYGEQFDAILVQERSSRRYFRDAARELSYIASANCPVYRVQDAGNGSINVCNSDATTPSIEFSGHEADLLTILPTRRTHALNRIAIPCASDLYQFATFQDIANKLLCNGYKLSIFESIYQHTSRVTKQRFPIPEHVNVRELLSLQEQVKEFRDCAFVLICSYSLRNIADIQTIVCAALMSGSLPIVIGDALPAYEFIDHFFSFERTFSYIRGIDMLTFQRIWLSKFRKLMRKLGNSQIRHNFLAEISGMHLKKSSCPSAEIICVSKRPENLIYIVNNIRRQSYKNIAVHIIWNVDESEADYCNSICQNLGIPNLQVSIVDAQYNIGTCLNTGIQASQATYWFKMDDDDYYGKFYIEDMLNYYILGNFDAVFKPPFFVSFQDKTLWGRNQTAYRHLGRLTNYGCGATLSGTNTLCPFSSTGRNSCDTTWQDTLLSNDMNLFMGDNFNYCTFRHTLEKHTWQISDAALQEKAYKLGIFSEEYLDAE